jgi:dihydrofolate reductase
VIGRDNALPWRLPADMRHFKSLTTGHTVIMGRRTYDSLGEPLPNRRNIVVTRDRARRFAGAEVAHGLDEALALAAGDDQVFVAGGADIYRLALPRAERIYLTVVHAAVEGDTLFPELDLDDWRLEEDIRHAADGQHAHPYSFRVYHRRRPEG